MKIACITTSQIPSSTANSIQAMKVAQSLAQVGGAVGVWSPGSNAVDWDNLAAHYGLTTPFEVTWVPARRLFKRYDFTLAAMNRARDWGADLIVVSAHRPSMATYLLGSNAAKIVRHADCTTLVVRSDKTASLLA